MTDTSTAAAPPADWAPGWLRALLNAPTYRYLQAGMLVVLVVAFVTSFESGSNGAVRLGYLPDFGVSFPLVCDVVAAIATLLHGRSSADRAMRRTAAWFVLVPMLFSWAGNAVDHLSRAQPAPAWPTEGQAAWIAGVILAAGICPVAVAALLHLSTKYVEFEHRQAEVAAKAAVRRATNTKVEPPALKSRPGRVDTPPLAPDVPTGVPTPAPVKRKPQRTAAERQAAAERSARSRRHKTDDHSLCLPGRCPDAPRVRAA